MISLKKLRKVNWFVKSTESFVNSKYFEQFFILASAVTACISIAAFTYLLGTPIGTLISAIRLKICAIAAGITECKPIIKGKKKKYDKTALLSKSKLNNAEVVIYKVLIDSNISYDEFV